MIKFLMLFFLALLIAAVLLYGFAFLHWVNPFKVIDPSSSKFQLKQFRFEDYPDAHNLHSALSMILERGTPVSEVDKILVDFAGAKKFIIKQQSDSMSVNYCHVAWYESLTALASLSDMQELSVEVRYDGQGNLLSFGSRYYPAHLCK